MGCSNAPLSQHNSGASSRAASVRGGSGSRRKKESTFDQWLKRKTVQEKDLKRQLENVQQPEAGAPNIVKSTKKSQKLVVRDLEEVRRIFNSFDEDKSGAIEPPEFLPLLC